MPAKNAAQA